MYIELDHALVPRKKEDIHSKEELPGREKHEVDKESKVDPYKLHKYPIKQGISQNILLEFEKGKLDKIEKAISDQNDYEFIYPEIEHGQMTTKNKARLDVNNFEPVIGPSEEVFHDEDFGFFSAIIACYNNHWVLKTSPDDWWNVIARTVAHAIDENGDKENVRKFFIDHDAKKEIKIILPHLPTLDYSWLFDNFSEGIRKHIKTPGYVDMMLADFSTTTPNQRITSQMTIMSSIQKYFSYSYGTACGIPGVEMKGTKEDWEKLVRKTEELEKSLKVVMEEINLGDWFANAKNILGKLLETFNGQPDKVWWSHILSWNKIHGSGGRKWWSGWMIDFLGAGKGELVTDFPSGTVSVPVLVFGETGTNDVGLLVAGTVGYTVEEQPGMHAPMVEAKQSWALLLSKQSPMTSFLK